MGRADSRTVYAAHQTTMNSPKVIASVAQMGNFAFFSVIIFVHFLARCNMRFRWLFAEKNSIIYFNLDKYFLERQATARFATARGLPRQHQWCASLCCRMQVVGFKFKRDTPDTTVISCCLSTVT